MNFPDVKNWTIPEGSVKKVIDSQYRVIWQKDTYTLLDYVSTGDNDAWGGIIVPINIPRNASYEIGFEYRLKNLSTNGEKMNLDGNNSYKYILNFPSDAWYGSYSIYENSTQAGGYYYAAYSNPIDTHQKLLLLSSYNRYGYWYPALDNSPRTNIGGQSSSVHYTQLNNSANFTGYWGFGVIATGANSYLTDSTATTNRFKGDIYNCYIKVDDEYVCNLVPAIKDRTGAYGLYDEINQIFYPSCTDTPFTHTVIPITSLTLSDNVAYVGRTYALPFSYSPSNATVDLTWISSDTSKATIDSDGRITGVSSTWNGPGSGTGWSVESQHTPITVTVSSNNSSASATCNIYVSPDGEITITPNPIRVKVEERASFSTNKPGNGFIARSEGPTSVSTNTVELVSSSRIKGVRVGSGWIRYPYVTYQSKSAHSSVTVTDNSVAVTGISLDKSSATIGYGGSTTLVATVTPSDATDSNVSWSSSNTSIATVDNGVVTGVGTGTATITASCGGYSDTCTITVSAPDPITSVSVSLSSVTLANGDTQQLSASCEPSTVGSVTYSWSSSNTNVATVSSSGKITASSSNTGTAIITCTATDYYGNTRTDTCTVTVQSTVQKYNITIACSNVPGAKVSISGYGSGTGSYTVSVPQGTTISYTVGTSGYITETDSFVSGNMDYTRSITLTAIAVTGVSLNKNTLTLSANANETLIATVTPSDALNKSVTWSSSDTSVATVNQSGKVTAKATGTATITVTTSDGGYTANCTVTVSAETISVSSIEVSPKSLSMEPGGTHTLTATVYPSDATNKHVFWGSSDSSVATVNATSGKVTAVGVGTTTIICTSNSDQSITDTCVVTVSSPNKTVNIVNNTGDTIYYHREDLGDAGLTAGSNTSVIISSGDALYIRTTNAIPQNVVISCNSSYTTTSGYYKITYANAINNDTVFVSY